MFIPYRVDVPFNHRPVVNWVVVAGVILVFCLQLAGLRAYSSQPLVITADPNSERGFAVEAPEEMGGITGRWLLDGWGVRGLFGHMRLHAGILHLIGNLIFLWLFGNAVCSKIGNSYYLPAYVLCGLAAAIAHLLLFDVSMLGASGAIMGMVGMYLVFFPENSISCILWFVVPLARFNVSGYWLILVWFAFDIMGAMYGGGGVAYFAHIGGFLTGLGLATLLLKKQVIVMERDEKSIFELLGLAKADKPTERRGDFAPWQREWGGEEGLQSGEKQQGRKKESEPEEVLLEEQEPVTRFIRFQCRCGQRIKIAGKYAGLIGRCPKCSARLKIPSGRENVG